MSTSSRAQSVVFGILILLCCGAATVPATAQEEALTKASRELHLKWFDRERERPDAVLGSFDVLRFPTGYTYEPRYQHGGRKKRQILNPDFYCTECARTGRIARRPEALAETRLMERPAEELLAWLKKETKPKSGWAFIEDEEFKLWFDLKGVNLRLFRNPFLPEELAELGDLFPEVTPKSGAIDGHKRAHLYLIRARRILRDFWWMTGTDREGFRKTYHWLPAPMGMKAKHELYVFREERDHNRFSTEVIGRYGAGGQVWHNFNDGALVMMMHGQSMKDPQVQNGFIHRLAHLYLDAWRGYHYKLPAWFQMGLGHWMERRESGDYNTFCFSEGSIPRVLFTTKWTKTVRKALDKGKVPPFVELCGTKEYADFDIALHPITWSWFAYLWSLGPEKMPRFLEVMKGKKEGESLYQLQVRAFREAYGISLLQFDAGWRAWVKAVYRDA